MVNPPVFSGGVASGLVCACCLRSRLVFSNQQFFATDTVVIVVVKVFKLNYFRLHFLKYYVSLKKLFKQGTRYKK